MKSYHVVVSYQDSQDGQDLTKTYQVEADCEFNAGEKAMRLCGDEFWTNNPISANALEVGTWDARVQELEYDHGFTRSDAQAIADTEFGSDLQAVRA